MANVDKNAKQKRVKSAYRDGKFHPLFQAVDAFEQAVAEGGISVTYVIPPSRPTQPTKVISINKPPQTNNKPKTTPEQLTDKEREHSDRFWRQYNIETPHLTNHRKPALWRDLSDQARIEWFHRAMHSTGNLADFTLNLSPEIEAKVRAAKSATKYLADRLNRELKAALGRKVDLWFVFELTDRKRLHIHGEVNLAAKDFQAARKAMRRAGGEWTKNRQHQVKIREAPTVVWANYCAKESYKTQPKAGYLSIIKRPISGDWYYASNNVRSESCIFYNKRRTKLLSEYTNIVMID
ncbi:hypothetical protein IMCC20628_02743 [Hoeflea sp. IMCC20628]|uniref:hypothetical protein n=1 Tax=Hoeflea sp. IMCC20628 TaxID=1620421 RepID=UPI00063A9328|nr:hypothetical protein [Hoeflea sp. IMCC20628]AKI01439.1 hypothetical protein IMCC20628_02743 [Hoeflea sp. IMCC20628]